jgi:hypothetical protein
MIRIVPYREQVTRALEMLLVLRVLQERRRG